MTAAELAYLAAGVGIGIPLTILAQRHRIAWSHWRARRRIRRSGLRLVDADGWHPSRTRKHTR